MARGALNESYAGCAGSAHTLEALAVRHRDSEPAHAILSAKALASASRLASARLIAAARASPSVSEIDCDPNRITIGVGWLVLPRRNAPIHRIVHGCLARCCRFSHAGTGGPHGRGRARASRIELVT